MKSTWILTFLFSLIFISQADGQRQKNDSIRDTRYGFLPAVGFDTDLGFKYGLLASIYYFDDWKYYPKYYWNINYEFNRTTKGSGTQQLFLDYNHFSGKKPWRAFADFSYLTEDALDFYGLNGATAVYNQNFSDPESSQYVSRMFYRIKREIYRATIDFRYPITKRFLWQAGLHFYDFRLGNVDLDKINKGKDSIDVLPDTTSLYDFYIANQMIKTDETNGGIVSGLKTGLLFDSRDKEQNPSRGTFSEIMFFYVPKLSFIESPFFRITATLRQYIPIIKDKHTLALRFAWQDAVGKQAPFYFASYITQSYSSNTIVEGLGGSKTIRGTLRNRMLGDGIAYSNIEWRYTFYKKRMGKQNISLVLSPFFDFGIISDPIKTSSNIIIFQSFQSLIKTSNKDQWHSGSGIGFHFCMNDNFVLSFDYGRSLRQQDGKSGFYISTGFLF